MKTAIRRDVRGCDGISAQQKAGPRAVRIPIRQVWRALPRASDAGELRALLPPIEEGCRTWNVPEKDTLRGVEHGTAFAVDHRRDPCYYPVGIDFPLSAQP
jgi:hypothetical protein